MTGQTGSIEPTVVGERVVRRNVAFGAALAILAFTIASTLTRDGAVDTPTWVATGALAAVAVGVLVTWAIRLRSPGSLVVGDDTIELVPAGSTLVDRSRLRIDRSDEPLRLSRVGSVRSKTLTLSSVHGDGRIPLTFIDRDDVLDACHAHGWTFHD